MEGAGWECPGVYQVSGIIIIKIENKVAIGVVVNAVTMEM